MVDSHVYLILHAFKGLCGELIHTLRDFADTGQCKVY